ncbi:MAG: M24 family metallopeptidase [Solirubrobacteraceae bacterium]
MTTLLMFGDCESSPAMRHEVPLAIGDPFMFADIDGRCAVLTSSLERARIEAVLPGVELLDFTALGMRELAEQGYNRRDSQREIAARAVTQLGISAAVVPWDFPVSIADRLREDGVQITVDDAFVDARRRVKAGPELAGIRAAQDATNAAMAAAAAILSRATPGPDGDLLLDGEVLLAERVRDTLRAVFTEHGASCPAEMMVASVRTGFGHDPGSGPLPAGLPIQVDLFPRDNASGCWADMTRTFVVGEPTSEHAALIAEQEQLVRRALEQARDAIAPGVIGRDLHAATCELFEQAGYATLRTGDPDGYDEGFQFSLGHGVGLEVHEPPGLGLSGREPFLAGDVVAIEPGLWDRRIGGVRFEDLLLVTDDGCETLTSFSYSLTPAR